MEKCKDKYNMTEDEIMVQKMYPKEDLHGLNEKRICFSLVQLKFTLSFGSNKKKRESFLDFCQEMLIKKGFKSLDFYDVYRLIDAVIENKPIKTPDFLCYSNPIEEIDFSVESAVNFTFQKLDEIENININEKVKYLEKRLNNFLYSIYWCISSSIS